MANADDYIAIDPADDVRWVEATDIDALKAIRVGNLPRIRTLSAEACIRIAAWGALLKPGFRAKRGLAATSLDGACPVYDFG